MEGGRELWEVISENSQGCQRDQSPAGYNIYSGIWLFPWLRLGDNWVCKAELQHDFCYILTGTLWYLQIIFFMLLKSGTQKSNLKVCIDENTFYSQELCHSIRQISLEITITEWFVWTAFRNLGPLSEVFVSNAILCVLEMSHLLIYRCSLTQMSFPGWQCTRGGMKGWAKVM